jgi:uncharacterized membrane protein
MGRGALGATNASAPISLKTMQRRTLHRLFHLGVVVKGLDGALEVLGGLMFLVVDPRTLNALVLFLTAHEISEDPADLIATALRRGVRHLSFDTTVFAGAYLAGHGFVKVLLAAGLLQGRLWAYPAALWFLAAFAGYQTYRVALGHSVALLALTLLDVIVMSLIWREYRYLKARGPARA